MGALGLGIVAFLAGWLVGQQHSSARSAPVPAPNPYFGSSYNKTFDFMGGGGDSLWPEAEGRSSFGRVDYFAVSLL